MCRMLGVVFRGDFPMESLLDLREVARDGRIPETERLGHNDGWGIVSFKNASPWYIGRSALPMSSDRSFDSALDDVARVSAPNILIAHVRALSTGVASIPNTHPFVMGNLVLAHNGTLFDFHPRTKNQARGDTDSERLLAVLSDRMDQIGDLESSLKAIVREDIHGGSYSAAILFVSDGKRLFAYRDYSPGRSAEYYDLKMSKSKDCVILFQEMRSGHNGETSQMENRELVSIDLDLNVSREMIR